MIKQFWRTDIQNGGSSRGNNFLKQILSLCWNKRKVWVIGSLEEGPLEQGTVSGRVGSMALLLVVVLRVHVGSVSQGAERS